MNRLKKKLREERIIFTEDEYMSNHRYSCPPCEETLVDIVGNYIITVWTSAVMPAEFHIYNRNTYMPVATQCCEPESTFSGARTWGSFVFDNDF